MKLSKTMLISRPFIWDILRVRHHGIAHRLKIKFHALQIKHHTTFLWNRKVHQAQKCTQTVFLRQCHLRCSASIIQTIRGFENAIIARPGYAIEYDYVFPNQLHHTLEVKSIPGLFLAGQINGTTGYEEAAGQGIIAGINAHLKAHGQEPYIMPRTQGYIGIMIDDLVTLGVDEPYRMFTSRAERRLTLRQDNVFTRLADDAYRLHLIDQKLYEDIQQEKAVIEATIATLRASVHKHRLLMQTLSEGNIDAVYAAIHEAAVSPISERAAASVYAELLYGLLQREEREIEKMEQYQDLHDPN